MAQEAFCPEHGPYDRSLGACPFPHGKATANPGIPTSFEDDIPTELPARRRSGRGILDFDEEDEGGSKADEPDDFPYNNYGNRVLAKKFRTEKKSIGLRVFVSSTYEDLKEYREVVFNVIHGMLGYSDDMLFWSADDRDPLSVSIDRVRQCDLVILLVAHRYGYVPSREKYSITESEYRAAKEASIPVLAFFVDQEAPWPPKYVETERKEQLSNFKKLIESDVVRKTFKSKDELLALVTQALHHFIDRRNELFKSPKYFRATVLVKRQKELLFEPDVVTHIGESEDDLPLLIDIKRSKDIGPHIDSIAEMIISSSSDRFADSMLDSFRDQIERHAGSSWARHRIFSVQMKNGPAKKMYITEKNLSQLTSSLLSNILDSSKPTKNNVQSGSRSKSKQLSYDDEFPTEMSFDRDESKSSNDHLQSVSGTNRFLGISLESDEVYSVGYQLNEWVEWRPFHAESIHGNFTDYKFEVHSEELTDLGLMDFSSYVSFLESHAIKNIDDAGHFDADAYLVISRQSVGKLIARIAKSIEEFHAKGKLHGDLKAKNILLTKTGPILIDDFNIKLGEYSPGWTPNWSSPEQVVQEPLTAASDIYPLGMLVAALIDGKLVGEVRKFKIPTFRNADKEHDVFYNPSISVQTPDIFTKGKNEWVAFVKSCLKFESGKRPQSATAFLDYIESLLKKYPLNGDIKIKLDNSGFVIATLLDGSKKIARLISDHE
jgi:hypothetical protein